MFANAYKIAAQFTFPVLISSRFYDGTVESGIGSFVILNDEGWIATAGHVLAGLQTSQQHAAEIQQIQNTLTTDLTANPKWITNHSLWWGSDAHRISQFQILHENDFAIGKIENFNPDFVKQYPTFQNPKQIEPGTSLCKLGFPFYDVKASFIDANQSFAFDSSVFPIPIFPMEGISTRNFVTGRSQDGNFIYKWLETSSPGLRGQSGGPIFDTSGKIWAIQSQTHHLPLGFSPKVIKNGIEIEENQFLNVGWGVHVESILKFLDYHGVKYHVDN